MLPKRWTLGLHLLSEAWAHLTVTLRHNQYTLIYSQMMGSLPLVLIVYLSIFSKIIVFRFMNILRRVNSFILSQTHRFNQQSKQQKRHSIQLISMLVWDDQFNLMISFIMQNDEREMKKMRQQYLSKLAITSQELDEIVEAEMKKRVEKFIGETEEFGFNHHESWSKLPQSLYKQGEKQIINCKDSSAYLQCDQQYLNRKKLLQSQLLLLRKQQHQSHSQLKKSPDNLSQLKLQKKILTCTRRQQEIIKIILDLNQKYEEEKSKRNQQQLQKIKKKQDIINRLKLLQAQKQKRKKMLSSKSLERAPLYKKMEKKFFMEEIKKQIEKSFEVKKIKEEKMKRYAESIEQGIRKHINITKSTSLNRIKTQNDNKSSVMDAPTKKQLLQHSELLRKKIKLRVSPQKQLQLQMLKDKLEHPQKYTFLKLKQLTEQQIFQQFRDFQIKYDRHALGDQYLKEVNSKMKSAFKNRVKTEPNHIQTRSQLLLPSTNSNHAIASQSPITNRTNPSKLSSNSNSSQKHQRQIKLQKILKESESKSKVLQRLGQQTAKVQQNINGLMSQLKSSKPYEELLKIQGNIDDDYFQFVRNRVAALHLRLK